MKRHLLPAFGALLVLLSACSSAPPIQKFPDMMFTKKTPYSIDCARIEVVSEYKAPAEKPHIEYDMPVSPENAMRNWVRDRLKAVGHGNIMRVVIHNASATETPLQTDTGITGMFKKEQSAQVDLALDISIQMLDEQQFVVAEVSGKASRTRTEVEGQKLNERDKMLYDLTYDLVSGIDSEVSDNIPVAFARWMGMK